MGRLAPLPEKGDDVRQGGTGPEDADDAHVEQLRHVGLGDDAADEDADVVQTRLAQELEKTRGTSVMWAPESSDGPRKSASSSATSGRRLPASARGRRR